MCTLLMASQQPFAQNLVSLTCKLHYVKAKQLAYVLGFMPTLENLTCRIYHFRAGGVASIIRALGKDGPCNLKRLHLEGVDFRYFNGQLWPVLLTLGDCPHPEELSLPTTFAYIPQQKDQGGPCPTPYPSALPHVAKLSINFGIWQRTPVCAVRKSKLEGFLLNCSANTMSVPAIGRFTSAAQSGSTHLTMTTCAECPMASPIHRGKVTEPRLTTLKVRTDYDERMESVNIRLARRLRTQAAAAAADWGIPIPNA